MVLARKARTILMLAAVSAAGCLAAAVPAEAGFFTRTSSCTTAAFCVVVFPGTSSLTAPQLLSCHWTQSSATSRMRRLLLQKFQTAQTTPGWTLAFPIDSASASAYALNLQIQNGLLVTGKDGTLNARFEFSTDVTVSLTCTLFYTS